MTTTGPVMVDASFTALAVSIRGIQIVYGSTLVLPASGPHLEHAVRPVPSRSPCARRSAARPAILDPGEQGATHVVGLRRARPASFTVAETHAVARKLANQQPHRYKDVTAR
jgi:hypothetical protein